MQKTVTKLEPTATQVFIIKKNNLESSLVTHMNDKNPDNTQQDLDTITIIEPSQKDKTNALKDEWPISYTNETNNTIEDTRRVIMH